MTRQCTCGGIIRQHELVGDREAWTCNACGRYGAIERGDAKVFDIERMSELPERAMSEIEHVLNDLTRGLPREDQAAIVEAVRNRTMERTSQVSGMVELHFVGRSGDDYWLYANAHDADVLLAPSVIRAEIERD